MTNQENYERRTITFIVFCALSRSLSRSILPPNSRVFSRTLMSFLDASPRRLAPPETLYLRIDLAELSEDHLSLITERNQTDSWVL